MPKKNEEVKADEEMVDVEVPIIQLNDEDGNPIDFVFLDEQYYDENYYIIVTPLGLEDEDSEEEVNEVFILKEEIPEDVEDDEESVGVTYEVADDKTSSIVFDLFKEKHKENFDFIEEQKTEAKKTTKKKMGK